MKKLFLIGSIAFVLLANTGNAQTKQYTKIETSHFKGDKISSKTIKYEGGTLDVDGTAVTIDKEAPKPQYYTIASKGVRDKEDEGYYSVEYIAVTEVKSKPKAVKIVFIYTPKNELADLIIKTGHSNIDYCFKD